MSLLLYRRSLEANVRLGETCTCESGLVPACKPLAFCVRVQHSDHCNSFLSSLGMRHLPEAGLLDYQVAWQTEDYRNQKQISTAY